MFISSELLIKSADFFGIELDNTAVDRFDKYAELLVKYNEKVNLTAITDPDEIVIKHFTDSLALFRFIDFNNILTVADVGTGAGFPGVALLIYNNKLNVTLFDAVNKKLDFIRFALSEIGLNADIVHIRAEDAGNNIIYREKFDLVTARAVAQLRILSEYCIPLVKVNGIFASLKGDISDEEKQCGFEAVKKLNSEVYDNIEYNIPSGDKRNIILIKKLSQISPKYPRPTAQIKKKPL